ncbi:hypothetical protein D8W71_15740 [Rhodococcus sp. P1Y]|nr:hypothetical protein D8W71_15740 [Rhodococcus sp. P1Y]
MALVPSPPLLVPELTGNSPSEASIVRDAALRASRHIADVADRWLVVGTGDRGRRIGPRSSGTFAGYGVDVPVTLSADVDGESANEADTQLPLPALIAGWLRGEAAPSVEAEILIVGRDDTRAECTRIGRDLRAEMDADQGSVGLLVVGDGATTLTAKAPGSFDERAEALQTTIDDALATADLTVLSGLDRRLCREVGVDGVAAWQVLASVVADDRLDAHALYRGSPFGVGYFVGTWDVV